MQYFKNENESGLSERWLLYDRIHLLAFLTDVMFLLKTFQKTFQSDSISLFNVQQKKENLFARLQNCADEPVSGGWEETFLSEIETRTDGLYFFGHRLSQNHVRSVRTATCSFTVTERKLIISSLLTHLNTRLEYDIGMRNKL